MNQNDALDLIKKRLAAASTMSIAVKTVASVLRSTTKLTPETLIILADTLEGNVANFDATYELTKEGREAGK